MAEVDKPIPQFVVVQLPFTVRPADPAAALAPPSQPSQARHRACARG